MQIKRNVYFNMLQSPLLSVLLTGKFQNVGEIEEISLAILFFFDVFVHSINFIFVLVIILIPSATLTIYFFDKKRNDTVRVAEPRSIPM